MSAFLRRINACAFALALAFVCAPARGETRVDAAALRDEAYQAVQRAMGTAAAAALSQLGARFSAGEDDLARAVRARQDLDEAARSVDRAVTLARATPGEDQSRRVTRLREEAEAARARLLDADADLARRFPAFAELSSPKPLSIAETQALLDDDEALALIFVGPFETFVWAVTRTQADWTMVARTREAFVADVKQLRAGLDPQGYALTRSGLRSFAEASVEGDAGSGRVVFERARAAALYRDLLQPFEKLIAAKPRLYAAVNAPFDSLPLALLVTAPPQGSDVEPDDLRATPWLIRRQAVVTLPAPGSLKALRAARPARAPSEPFRGYGAPLLTGPQSGPSGDTFDVASDAPAAALPETLTLASRGGAAASLYRGGVVDRNAISRLAPLPQTAGELRAMAAALGAGPDSTRLGAQATARAVREDDLSKFRVVAFATHGLLAGELTGLQEPALVFTPPAQPSPDDDGLLTASQAARLDLAADWVVLSACNTAGGDGAPGAEGFSGLARAFFYAGAKSLLVSHWPVRDDVAARLTTRMFAALGADKSLAKAQAHRLAVLEILDDARDPSLAHPALWAPFVVAGEGR